MYFVWDLRRWFLALWFPCSHCCFRLKNREEKIGFSKKNLEIYSGYFFVHQGDILFRSVDRGQFQNYSLMPRSLFGLILPQENGSNQEFRIKNPPPPFSISKNEPLFWRIIMYTRQLFQLEKEKNPRKFFFSAKIHYFAKTTKIKGL